MKKYNICSDYFAKRIHKLFYNIFDLDEAYGALVCFEYRLKKTPMYILRGMKLIKQHEVTDNMYK